MTKSIYFVGAGFTKSLQHRMPVPMMMDFVHVMAYYARRDDVVLMALIGLEAEGCFVHKNPVLRALANDVRPKRHRQKLLAAIHRREPESIEALLAAAERADRRMNPLSARALRFAIHDPVLRAQYAISRVFYKIGWNVSTAELEQYLRYRARKARSRHTFVSFNYDLVLEHALESAGTSWSAKSGYGAAFKWAAVEDPSEGGGTLVMPLVGSSSSTVVVLKPHGSLNWLAPVESSSRLPVVAATAAGHIRYIGTTATHPSVRFPNELPARVAPLIVPPTSSKNTDIALLRRLRTKEASALESADEVYIFGWSIPATDADQVRLLREAVAQRQKPFSRVVVVNYRQPETYYRRVARLFGVHLTRVERFDNGLREFIKSELRRASVFPDRWGKPPDDATLHPARGGRLRNRH